MRDVPVKGPLPKGRHGLSRQEVAASQRTRLLQAAVDLGIERGFASLTLTDIVGRAGVARSTFYVHFSDKQDCFLAAFDYAAALVFERVLTLELPALGEHATPAHAYTAVLLELALEEPGLVRLVAADAEALGPVAAERQREIRGQLADGLVALRDDLRRADPSMEPITQLRALAIVGALSEMFRHALYASGPEGIPALEPELATVLLALLEAPPS